MILKKFSIILFFVISYCIVNGQGNTGLYPIKKNGKWGIINQNGHIIVPTSFDAIGSFKQHNYAVVQKDGKAGLVDSKGYFVFKPQYEDIRVVSEYLFGMSNDGVWNIIDKQGRIILSNYDEVKPLNNDYILFWKKGFCGIVDFKGNLLIPAKYQHISWDNKNEVFQTKYNKSIGLYTKNGTEITSPVYKEIKYISKDLIFIKRKYKWGAINEQGIKIIPEIYSSYILADFDYTLLFKQEKCYLYSISKSKFINQEAFSNFIPLNQEWIVFQKYKKVGVINKEGMIIIPPNFEEIRIFDEHSFRVKINEKWGIINSNNEWISQSIFNYISPINISIAIGKKNDKYGIFNKNGKLSVNAIYDRIEMNDFKIKAYQGNKLSVFGINEDGLIKEDEFNKFTSISIKKRKRNQGKEIKNYQLDKFEWYYSLEKKKWGLRNNLDGSIKLPAQYDFIDIKREHDFTIAGIRKTKTEVFGDFPVRFNFHFHLIDNSIGMPTSEDRFREVRFSDFENGNPTARVIFIDGRHGLINKKGKIICRGYAYIGHFNEGLAPMAMRGKLSSATTKEDFVIGPMEEYLIGSYGSYIIGDFGNIPNYIPELSCKECSWGYIDSLGRMMVPPDYDAAKPFVQGSGIVRERGKWGLVNSQAKKILPCVYDKISRFDEEGKILHIESACQKYGLIDSLGRLICESKFEEIRDESNQLIAFKFDGKWGYMLPNGYSAIKPQFVKAHDFHEGKAAVFNGFKWGFINKRGEIIIDFKYSRVGNFKDGLAWVYTSKGIGYINEKHQFIIPIQFRKAYDFEDGIARVKVKDKIRLINTRGEFISNNQFQDLSSFDKYGLAVGRNNYKGNIHYFLVNKKGEKLNSNTFRKIYPFSEGMAAIKKKKKYGFINAQGQIMIPPTYDKVSQFSEGLAWVKIDGNCGYINMMGKFIVEPEFSKCKDFEDGKALVYVNARKGGLVDKDGDYVMQPKMNKILSFSEGKGLVKQNRKFHFVRESGEIYEGYYDSAQTFENGTALVEIDGSWGIINSKGVAIVSPKYEKIERMNNGTNKIKVSKLHGVVNPKGQYILYPNYEYLDFMDNDIIRVEQGGMIGYMNLNGEWIWKLQR